MNCKHCEWLLTLDDEQKSGTCETCMQIKNLEERKEKAARPLNDIQPGERVYLSLTAGEEARLQQLQDTVIARIQKAVRDKMDTIWSRIESVSVKHADTAPGIYVGLIEETTLTLDNGSEITYSEPVSATTAYNYVVGRAEQEGCTTLKLWE